MKKSVFTIGILAVVFGFTSCKDEKKVEAERTVTTYVTYVDSVSNVSEEDARTNWDAIDAEYQVRIAAAEASAAEDEAYRERVAASRAKYEALKAKYEAEREAAEAAKTVSPKQSLRNKLFGEGKMSEDMNFSWVNKDNILQVYQDFYDSYKANKEDFSREDYDEIKLLYEALDARKNTVEKEGLSSEDNNKIASIKFRFAPMFKVNRIGAKADENQDAKDEAN
ncbi:MAG: hypothetical protein V4535_00105 [Bacteroidota bacterium]